MVCDVIIPCRDEAAALPARARGRAHWVRPDRRRQRLDRWNGRCRRTTRSHGGPGGPARLRGRRRPCRRPHRVVDVRRRGRRRRLRWISATCQAACRRGSRRGRHDGRGPTTPVRSRRVAIAQAGTTLLATWLRRSSGFGVHDLAPMRICRRDDLLALDIRDRRFGYPLELMVKAARAGWTCESSPSPTGREPREPVPRSPDPCAVRPRPRTTSLRCSGDRPDGARRREGAGARRSQDPDRGRPR